ncbi:MAG: hypothetical protein JW803_06495 [Endomicrobiales bacterium]|nr:hypothetical protein [Endomicrobiales bacterium]
MAEKVAKAGVKRVEGYLYFIDKAGDISRAKMARGGKKGGAREKIAKVGVKKQEGYLYFVDKHGDVSRAKMVRRGKGKKKKRR